MGAWIRRYERRIEREILDRRPRGIPSPATSSAVESSKSQAEQPGEDPRNNIPPLGLREYWYPALPAKKVRRKPLYWNMLGDDLVLFRDRQGEVAALSDICPHRGASLSEGNCFYQGYLSCAYHGATFDRQGECVAFIAEGPDSKMVGNLKVRSYPTRTLRGWVFIWMGEGKPAPVEEDVPPEFFEADKVVLSSYTYWHLNWLIAIENHSDSHNASYPVKAIFKLFGIDPYTDIPKWGGEIITHFNTAPELIATGRADGLFRENSPRRYDVSQLAEMRFFQLTEQQVRNVSDELGIKAGLIKAETYKHQREDIRTLDAEGFTVFARHDLAEEFAYRIARAIDHHTQTHYISSSTFYSPRFAVHTGAPLHEGAARYYRECGYQPQS